MARSKTKGRKATTTSTAAARSTATRKTGSDRPKQAIVQVESYYSSTKRVSNASKRPLLRAPTHLSRYFKRPKPPPLPQEDQEMDHMQEAIRLADRYVKHDQAAYNTTIELIRQEGGFACLFVAMHESAMKLRLPEVRPILIQECLKDDLFLMVVAVIFLNKTTGTKAIPKFYEVTARWKTPTAFSQVHYHQLHPIIKDLGLGDIRTKALINLGKMWLKYPPVTPQMLQADPEGARAKRAINASLARKKNPILFKKLNDEQMPAIAHLPWVGQYAVDSYKIYCCGANDWKSVRPEDKELTRYVMWRWAMLGKAYDMEARAPLGYATPKFIEALINELVECSPYKTLDRLSDEERAAQLASAQIA